MEYSRRNKRSHNNDRAKADLFRGRFRHRLATAVTARDVEDFKAACAERRSVATVNHYLKFLKAVFNRAIRQGSLTYNPVRPVKLFQEHNARNRCLSLDEETCLLDTLPGWFRPLVILALHKGMRRGELQALKWQDVDFNAGTPHSARQGRGRSLGRAQQCGPRSPPDRQAGAEDHERVYLLFTSGEVPAQRRARLATRAPSRPDSRLLLP